jgi:hypothetical protein
MRMVAIGEKKLKFFYRGEQAVDANQTIFFEAVSGSYKARKGYLTLVSKNAITGAPVVIGPLEFDRKGWLELTEHCLGVAEQLFEVREDKPYPGDEIY